MKQKRMQHVLAEDRRLHRLAAAAAAATEAASAGPRRRREAVVIQSEKGEWTKALREEALF